MGKEIDSERERERRVNRNRVNDDLCQSAKLIQSSYNIKKKYGHLPRLFKV